MSFPGAICHRRALRQMDFFAIFLFIGLAACTGTQNTTVEHSPKASEWKPWSPADQSQFKDGLTFNIRVGDRNCSRGKDFTVEIAASDASRTQGLGDRPTPLTDQAGMLFVFDQERPLNFWMKRTLIPLGIIYFDHSGRSIRSLEMTVEADPDRPTRTYPSGSPALLALEISPKALEALGGGSKSLCWKKP